MKTHTIFSSPQGDIPVENKDLVKPFLINPDESHPTLLLGDFFLAVESFILKNLNETILPVLQQRDPNLAPDDINELSIRTEKHGTFYHIASVEFSFAGGPVKFAVSSAISPAGKATLGQDIQLLRHFSESTQLDYLPKIYCHAEQNAAGPESSESFLLVLGDWFDDYHEWHLTEDGEDIIIWDHTRGNRQASEKERFEILRQVSHILTLYYDIATGNQIFPWHHAAGDFIVRRNGESVDVRLTTVRDYRQIVFLDPDSPHFPLVSLLTFFLNLTIRTRLDKAEGTEQTVWAGDFAVSATVRGFMEALNSNPTLTQPFKDIIPSLHTLLKSFTRSDFEQFLPSLLDLYRNENPEECLFVERNIQDHLELLCRCLTEI
ncbi:hypothetical protein ACFL6N_07030 [Thermodesulfobacteriota bacterium]